MMLSDVGRICGIRCVRRVTGVTGVTGISRIGCICTVNWINCICVAVVFFIATGNKQKVQWKIAVTVS